MPNQSFQHSDLGNISSSKIFDGKPFPIGFDSQHWIKQVTQNSIIF